MPHRQLLLRIATVLAGGALVLALTLADKRNLTNDTALKPGTQGAPAQPALRRPALPPNPALDAQLRRLGSVEGMAKRALLDSIVTTLEAQGRPDYAADYAAQILPLESTAETQLRAGRLYRQATELPFAQADTAAFRALSDRAIALLEAAKAAYPSDVRIATQLGMAYVGAANPKYPPMMGIQMLREVVAQDPENVDAGMALGRFAMQTGQFDKAAGRFAQLLKTDPSNLPAALQLGICYVQLGNAAEARPLLGRVAASADTALAAQARRQLAALRP